MAIRADGFPACDRCGAGGHRSGVVHPGQADGRLTPRPTRRKLRTSRSFGCPAWRSHRPAGHLFARRPDGRFLPCRFPSKSDTLPPRLPQAPSVFPRAGASFSVRCQAPAKLPLAGASTGRLRPDEVRASNTARRETRNRRGAFRGFGFWYRFTLVTTRPREASLATLFSTLYEG